MGIKSSEELRTYITSHITSAVEDLLSDFLFFSSSERKLLCPSELSTALAEGTVSTNDAIEQLLSYFEVVQYGLIQDVRENIGLPSE